MDRLGHERDENGLKGVFENVFPIKDAKGVYSIEFVDYSIGDWRCKCGALAGLEHLRSLCVSCGASLVCDPRYGRTVACLGCGMRNDKVGKVCTVCGDMVSLHLRHSEQECKERALTYDVPLRVTLRLASYDVKSDGTRELNNVKEEDVYFGEIPLMTQRGTFIINGTERVIVSQLHRSPGVFFSEGKKRRTLYMAKIIPARGSWIEFEFDPKGRLHVRIDRKKRFPVTVLLRALGLESNEAILRRFHVPVTATLAKREVFRPLDRRMIKEHAKANITGPRGKVYLRKGEELTPEAFRALRAAGVRGIPVPADEFGDVFFVGDVVDSKTGEVLAEANQPLSPKVVERLEKAGIKAVEVFFPKEDETGEAMNLTLQIPSPSRSRKEAMLEIYRKMRPGDLATEENAKALFERMFFSRQSYDLSRVGRLKCNIKFGLEEPLDKRTLEAEDFYRVVEYLLKLRNGIGEVDDIDHLGNRRVRSVGELLENQFRIGLVRLVRAVQERMAIYKDIKLATPHEFINAKPVMSAVRDFFARSQLSQFMDQTNPLSEITHKRRLSALGPGGLSRERAGFEVRDVHPTHYGRICPIETPEGPNIGLISSLSTYARINDFGFIESPYRKVEKGKVIDFVKITNSGSSRKVKAGDVVRQEVVQRELARLSKGRRSKPIEYEYHPFYLSALEEEKYYIAQANTPIDAQGRIAMDHVTVRRGGNVMEVKREQVDFMDVSPKQVVSVAASLIPFLEHDDANRALMGSNMQRQSVPLVRPEPPIVQTGMEEVAAHDSGAVALCRRSGVVDKVDSGHIVVRVDTGEGVQGEETGFDADIYVLEKFRRSNQNTCVNQRPTVAKGQRVKKEQVLADGPATSQGLLSLGRNVLVAFLPWRGYNFEDAIVISERLVKDDVYTSIHIEEFETEARDTKLGAEEVTRDIPNISEKLLGQLDASGIIRIGAWVKPGDIIVGKVTPKGESQLTPEEKLLRAIFGEKAGDVKDTSLRIPPGIEGVVMDVRVFTRRGAKKDRRTQEIEEDQVMRLEQSKAEEYRIIDEEFRSRLVGLLGGQRLSSTVKHGKSVLARGRTLKPQDLLQLPITALKKMPLVTSPRVRRIRDAIQKLEKQVAEKKKIIEKHYRDKIDDLKGGEDLPAGVIKVVKVYIALKRKLSVGDKMAGRHGNKGVIARILPVEDMPHLEDGTPIDVVLNPLGVPSRMNVGQILETHLGWVAQTLGYRVVTPVFDGAREGEIKELLQKAGLPRSGKVTLYDGCTGEPFEQKVGVGSMYLMKLVHLVDDKIHARSIGPYSLVTQQPLGGKAQFGGQRLGEMEVWALEAYGAAHTLQEFLTAKADDIYGRTKIYEAIVKGDVPPPPELPESFNVMMRELRSLGLDVELVAREKQRKASKTVDID
ncbi:MAG: DNA-directed RNA polymerase subunit beta [Acidobacteriota bacterium]|nr:MAG: DNA-directed RNA polymerase subunit beta [Acidobacteriota bacterium]